MLWRKTVTHIAADYPDIELSHMYVDNAAMQLIRNPKQVNFCYAFLFWLFMPQYMIGSNCWLLTIQIWVWLFAVWYNCDKQHLWRHTLWWGIYAYRKHWNATICQRWGIGRSLWSPLHIPFCHFIWNVELMCSFLCLFRDLACLNLFMALLLTLPGRLEISFVAMMGTIIYTLCDFLNVTKNVQNKANPLATILSAAMLLKYGLGEEKAANRIETAVLDTLDRGFRTGDIYSVGLVRVSFFFVKYEWKAWLVSAIKYRFVQQTLVACHALAVINCLLLQASCFSYEVNAYA